MALKVSTEFLVVPIIVPFEIVTRGSLRLLDEVVAPAEYMVKNIHAALTGCIFIFGRSNTRRLLLNVQGGCLLLSW